MIWSCTGEELPPPGAGFTSVTARLPTVATSDEFTVTVTDVGVEVKKVCWTPLMRTVVTLEILVPVNVSWKLGAPAITDAGLIDVSVGTALTMGIVRVPEL